jgi:hypothetical protein
MSAIVHTPNPNSGVFYNFFSTARPYFLLLSARIIRWITEANQPLKIVADRQLQDLLIAGRPELMVPSRSTAAHDLKAVYERSADRIKKLLTVSGLSFFWELKLTCI